MGLSLACSFAEATSAEAGNARWRLYLLPLLHPISCHIPNQVLSPDGSGARFFRDERVPNYAHAPGEGAPIIPAIDPDPVHG
ncbi:hypothetical protein ACTXT7_014077 [Hymenolepis weldensis]